MEAAARPVAEVVNWGVAAAAAGPTVANVVVSAGWKAGKMEEENREGSWVAMNMWNQACKVVGRGAAGAEAAVASMEVARVEEEAMVGCSEAGGATAARAGAMGDRGEVSVAAPTVGCWVVGRWAAKAVRTGREVEEMVMEMGLQVAAVEWAAGEAISAVEPLVATAAGPRVVVAAVVIWVQYLRCPSNAVPPGRRRFQQRAAPPV